MNTKPLALGSCLVTFHHEYEPRPILNTKKNVTEIVRFPRATNVTIALGSNKVHARVSCSHKDIFTFEEGRKRALKKAFATSPFDAKAFKEERTRIWNDYNKLKPGGRW
jgi:hypothetical protein